MRCSIAWFAALVVVCANIISSDLVSAQNVAGKLASRSKLTNASASSTTKRRRNPFWRKNVPTKDDEDKDGESWRRNLILAYSELVIKSVIFSVVCVLASCLWSWRSQNEYKQVNNEEKGGKFQPLVLFGISHAQPNSLSFPLSFIPQLKTLFVTIQSSCIRVSFNLLKLSLIIFP